MNVNDLEHIPGFKTVYVADSETAIKNAYTGDLLSDVMANAPADSVLITIQAHKNTVAVATLAGIRAIVVCNNRSVPDDVIEAARAEKVSLFRTAEDQFSVSGRLYGLLGRGKS